MAVELIQFGPLNLTAAMLIFSISHIFADVLTEVYRNARARQVVCIGFACNLLAVVGNYTAGRLPPSRGWTLPGLDTPSGAQRAYVGLLVSAPLILVASSTPHRVGEFLNSFVLAKPKLATHGRRLWVRTMGSTVVSQVADTRIFVGIVVFGGLVPAILALSIMVGERPAKVTEEGAAAHLTYLAVNFLRRAENENFYDGHPNINPLTLRTGRPATTGG